MTANDPDVRCRLKPEELRWSAPPSALPELGAAPKSPEQTIIGQERALRALSFGLRIRQPGFHIYVSGPSGIGKMTAVHAYLDQAAAGGPPPSDWCYVHNFEDPRRPAALKLPAGAARRIKADMEGLLEHLRDEVPRAFDSEAYAAKRDEILRRHQQEHSRIMEELDSKAMELGFKVQVTPMGLVISPRSKTPRPGKEGPAAVSEAPIKRAALQKEVQSFGVKIRDVQARMRQKMHELDQEVVLFLVGGLMDEMMERYRGLDAVTRHLRAVRADLLKNIDLFKQTERPQTPFAPGAEHPLRKYAVNVFVDNSSGKGAPVVALWNPELGELCGRIDKESLFGFTLTDFTLVKAGALQQANGGYLVLQIEDLLRSPFSWDFLKRALRSGRIAPEDPAERMGLSVTQSLKPEPIPLDLKVILVGSPHYYYLLHSLDEDFAKLFQVRADFDTQIPKDEKGMKDILTFLALLRRKEGLPPIDAAAAAKLLEHAARLAESQEQLSTNFGSIAEVVKEAAHWAEEAGAERIGEAEVKRALQERELRSDLVESHWRDQVKRGRLLIATAGEAVGQVNGLAVIQLGDHSFGSPTRITASVGPGREGLVDIEREVELSGPIHSKGILILNGYLVHRYAQKMPLTLTARLVFEQSYTGVEGDSASSAELYALLSALSDLPIRQGIAVTGSVNQRGEIQAIGGVNEKVEGFFETCRMQGLDGKQGVLIPESNRKDLMLKEEIVEAVRAGRFHLWAVRDADEGIRILTGRAAGERGAAGDFPEGSVNALIEAKLQLFSECLQPESETLLLQPQPEEAPAAKAARRPRMGKPPGKQAAKGKR